jgi:predicted RNA-binding protein with PIN domain
MGRMIYIIDGHNLIPKIPGLSLSALDDEERLIELLQVFSRVRRSAVEVFFDGAPPGQAGTRRFGTVKAHFVRAGRTADDAIVVHLRTLGTRAAQVSVVSSDHRVQAEARSLRASLIESGSFARDLLEAQVAAQPGHVERREAPLGAEEVDEWLKLFNSGKKSE